MSPKRTTGKPSPKKRPRRPAADVVVGPVGPPDPIPEPEGVYVIHPGVARFLDFLVERYVADLVAGRITLDPATTTEPEPVTKSKVITVDEAVEKYGMNRQEILKRFEEAAEPFEVRLEEPQPEKPMTQKPTRRRISKSARAEALFPVTDTPLSLDPKSPRVWGVPLDPAWWCDPVRAADIHDAIPLLGVKSNAARAASRPHFAFEVACAYAEARSWERSGVPIRGRRWVDLGGGDGAYLVALKVLGASEVTLVDLHAPVIAAVPVLEAAGVRLIVGDMRTIEPVDADAACFLHVTLPVDGVFHAAPRAEVVVIDRFFGKRDARMIPAGWKARRIKAADLEGAIERCASGERMSVAAARAREQRIVWTPD